MLQLRVFCCEMDAVAPDGLVRLNATPIAGQNVGVGIAGHF